MTSFSKVLFLALGMTASLACAAEPSQTDGQAPLLGMEKPVIKVENPDTFYVGVGLFSDMVNANVEVVTDDWGIFMLRAGRFHNVGQGFAANMSWRKPLAVEDVLGSGYYVGVFAGQVSADVLDAEIYQRLGGGAEMGYHWVSEYTRSEVMLGIGAAKGEKSGSKELTTEPTIFFSFNIALGY